MCHSGAANRADAGTRGIMRTTQRMFSLRQLVEDWGVTAVDERPDELDHLVGSEPR